MDDSDDGYIRFMVDGPDGLGVIAIPVDCAVMLAEVDVDVSEFAGPVICRTRTREIPADHMQTIAALSELGFAPSEVIKTTEGNQK